MIEHRSGCQPWRRCPRLVSRERNVRSRRSRRPRAFATPPERARARLAVGGESAREAGRALRARSSAIDVGFHAVLHAVRAGRPALSARGGLDRVGARWIFGLVRRRQVVAVRRTGVSAAPRKDRRGDRARWASEMHAPELAPASGLDRLHSVSVRRALGRRGRDSRLPSMARTAGYGRPHSRAETRAYTGLLWLGPRAGKRGFAARARLHRRSSRRSARLEEVVWSLCERQDVGRRARQRQSSPASPSRRWPRVSSVGRTE